MASIRQYTWRHAMRASQIAVQSVSSTPAILPSAAAFTRLFSFARQTTSVNRRSFFSTQTNNDNNVTRTPSASASTSASSLSTASPSSSSSSSSSPNAPDYSTPESRARIVDSARYHRRARLWLVAVITSAAAVVTYYRYLKQSGEYKAELETRKAQVEKANLELENMTRDQAERRDKAQKIINSLAPINATTQQASTPSSFLTAVSYDLRHKLQLGGVDPAVEVNVPTPKAQITKPTTAVVPVDNDKVVEEAPKKPRKAVVI